MAFYSLQGYIRKVDVVVTTLVGGNDQPHSQGNLNWLCVWHGMHTYTLESQHHDAAAHDSNGSADNGCVGANRGAAWGDGGCRCGVG